MKKALFIDRDGTLIQEPADEQIDDFSKLVFVPGTFRALTTIRELTDYELVMVSNQDGLGTESFPEETFWPVHNFILDTLKGEGVEFDNILIDRHFPHENAPTRKPGTGMLTEYMTGEYDLANSYVIGDRATDVQLAENLGCRALQIGTDGMDWKKITEILVAGSARRVKRISMCVSTLTAPDAVIFPQDSVFSTTCSHRLPTMADSRSRFIRRAICKWTNTIP